MQNYAHMPFHSLLYLNESISSSMYCNCYFYSICDCYCLSSKQYKRFWLGSLLISSRTNPKKLCLSLYFHFLSFQCNYNFISLDNSFSDYISELSHLYNVSPARPHQGLIVNIITNWLLYNMIIVDFCFVYPARPAIQKIFQTWNSNSVDHFPDHPDTKRHFPDRYREVVIVKPELTELSSQLQC